MPIPVNPPKGTFAEGIATLDASDADRVRGCISGWTNEPWVQVAANLRKEPGLTATVFGAILSDLTQTLASGTPAQEAWIEVCRRNRFKGALHPHTPKVLGRAMPIGTFAARVSESSGLPTDACRKLLREIAMAGGAVHPRKARILRKALLGRYVVWATFSQSTPDSNPFDDLPHSTRDIRVVLGLGHLGESDDLVLLAYETQNGTVVLEVYRPTVWDADDSPWFRPNPDPDDPFGETLPLTPNPLNLPPQPEVVHRDTTCEKLLFPIYLTV